MTDAAIGLLVVLVAGALAVSLVVAGARWARRTGRPWWMNWGAWAVVGYAALHALLGR